MKKILYLLLTLPSLGFSSNTILETNNLKLGEVLNHSYFFEEANKGKAILYTYLVLIKALRPILLLFFFMGLEVIQIKSLTIRELLQKLRIVAIF